jgi:hypothetical protein
VTFNVAAVGTQPIRYQWRLGGIPIVGATNASYSIAEVILTDNSAQFSVVVSNVVNGALQTATSSSATLTVVADTTGPTVRTVSATGQALLTVLDAVQIEFNEKVRADTATNIMNYALNGPGGPVAITGASIDAGGRYVLLSTATLMAGASYTVTISGVRDRARRRTSSRRTRRPISWRRHSRCKRLDRERPPTRSRPCPVDST